MHVHECDRTERGLYGLSSHCSDGTAAPNWLALLLPRSVWAVRVGVSAPGAPQEPCMALSSLQAANTALQF